MPKIKLGNINTWIGVIILFKFITIILLYILLSVESRADTEDKSIFNYYQKTDIKNINIKNIEKDMIEIEKLAYEEKIQTIMKIISIYFKYSDIENINKYIEKGLSISDKKIHRQKFLLYKAYVTNLSDKEEDINESLKIIDSIVTELKDLNDYDAKKIKFDAYIFKGDTYLYLNKASDAMKAYEESEKFKYSDINIFDVKVNKLFLYYSLELGDLALIELNELENQLKILDIEEKTKYEFYEIVYRFGVYLYEKKKDFKKSNDYGLKYLNLIKDMPNSAKIDAYYMLSGTYSNLKDFKKAEYYFSEIKNILNKEKVEYNVKEELTAKYLYYKNKNNYKEALNKINDLGKLIGEEKISNEKSEIYKEMKDYKNSYKYLDIYLNYRATKVDEEELDRNIKNTEKRHINSLNDDITKLNEETTIQKEEIIKYERKNKILTINNYLINSIIILSIILLFALIKLSNKYYKMSHTDGLTDLFNKRYLNKKINNYENILIIDIDYFKKVNDKYGHLAGDFILKEFSKILKKEFIKTGKIIRYGGEEFVILFDKNINSYKLAENLRKKVESHDFNFNEHTIKITISLGLAENFNKADKYLYIAKNSGRNMIVS